MNNESGSSLSWCSKPNEGRSRVKARPLAACFPRERSHSKAASTCDQSSLLNITIFSQAAQDDSYVSSVHNANTGRLGPQPATCAIVLFVVVQKRQGANSVAQDANANEEANSSQSPLIWRSTPRKAIGESARVARTESEACHGRWSCLPLGNFAVAIAEKLQARKTHNGWSVHHPEHPQRHSEDFLYTAITWREDVARLYIHTPSIPSLRVLGTPSIKRAKGTHSPGNFCTIGCE